MKFREELTYDADVARVRAMLAEEDFRAQVCDAQHVLARTVSITPHGDGAGMQVRVEQQQPADKIPAFAQKIVGRTIDIVQEETWHDATSADLLVTIPGKPGRLSGTIRLEETASGTREVVEGDVKVSIPVVGGKLEKLIGQLLGSALRAENRVGRAWLAGS
ncbi:DUF2505 domain-containing protein [Nocardioides massiliensis]|uniref:DUF2505 domain-containing protein n=1 Tax=Nocardioides massiliensis TaxID=1325935 RepID=A0ABT9NV50_9ACTN|nr:DUF2505 domain-containing protein [Nocardioides massiliensis]MDP9824162.1 hypothetical protein [Nocardioides massiliensis]